MFPQWRHIARHQRLMCRASDKERHIGNTYNMWGTTTKIVVVSVYERLGNTRLQAVKSCNTTDLNTSWVVQKDWIMLNNSFTTCKYWVWWKSTLESYPTPSIPIFNGTHGLAALYLWSSVERSAGVAILILPESRPLWSGVFRSFMSVFLYFIYSITTCIILQWIFHTGLASWKTFTLHLIFFRPEELNSIVNRKHSKPRNAGDVLFEV
jgi:hypothetical protein